MRSNPFATRFTRPGALPYLFPQGQSAETIVASLAQAQWWGEIIGPHGSGKSTLLAALIPELQRQGRQVTQLVLRSDIPVPASWPLKLDGRTPQVVVDGYEQLSWWNRWKLKAACRKASAGLLITAHHSCGLKTLFETSPTPELTLLVVRQLLSDGDQTIVEEDVRGLCRQEPTNVREVLFRLYDLYQGRSS